MSIDLGDLARVTFLSMRCPSSQNSELDPAEWDFRSIPGCCLQIATEYEYARESRFAPEIESWQKGSFWSIDIFRWLYAPSFLLELQLIKGNTFAVFSKLARYCTRAVANDTADRLRKKIYSGWPNADKNSITFAEVIKLASERFTKKGEFVRRVESNLRSSLPESIVERNLQKIALRFDDFPKPIVATIAVYGDQYLIRRMEGDDKQTDPITDISYRPIDYLDALDSEPSLSHNQFIIDWSYPPDVLSRAFRKFITERHPLSRPGNRPLDARLKWLAAYRLKKSGLKYDDAIEIVDLRSGGKIGSMDVYPNYRDRAEWDKAAKAAEKTLEGDFISEIRSLSKPTP